MRDSTARKASIRVRRLSLARTTHPGGRVGVGAGEDVLEREVISLPFGEPGDVGVGELPALERVVAAGVKALELHLAADGQPQLDQNESVAHQPRLEFRRLLEEQRRFLFAAEAHHPLDARAVVPGAVKQDHGAPGRQMRHIALEVPLAALDVRRLGERDRLGMARVQVLHEAVDGAVLTGGVAPLEQDDDALPLGLDPALHLEQLDLQRLQLGAVGVPLHHLGVGEPAARQRLVGNLLGQDGIVDVEAWQLLARAHIFKQEVVRHVFLSPRFQKAAPPTAGTMQQNGPKGPGATVTPPSRKLPHNVAKAW